MLCRSNAIIPLILAVGNITSACYMFGGHISWFNDFYTLSILAVGNATEACFVPAGITSETITLYQCRQSGTLRRHALHFVGIGS